MALNLHIDSSYHSVEHPTAGTCVACAVQDCLNFSGQF